jgi:uncharacterized repeat protein (TIGR01451 family)
MSSKRTARSAGRRLRLEFLETREVPDATVPNTDPAKPTDTVPVQTSPPDTKPTDPAQTTPPPDSRPTDPAPGGIIVPAVDPADPTVIYTTSAVDGEPQGPVVDLSTQTSISNLKPSLGDTVTIKVTVTNNGDVQATGVQLTTTLPAGMTFVSSDVGPSKYDPTTGAWDVGTLAFKGKAVLTLKAKVTDAAAQEFSATISHSDQADDKETNNAAAVNVTPVLGSLKLTKTVSTPAVAVGSTVVFTLAVGNGGPGMARGVTVTDTLGSGLLFARVVSASHGSFNPATGTWTIGALPAGQIAVLRMAVVVNKFAQIDSPASITGGTGYDPARSKVDATAVITGVRPNGQATWAFFNGPMFGVGTPPVPSAAKPTTPVLPAFPIQVVSGSQATTYPSLLQFLLTTGFKFVGH